MVAVQLYVLPSPVVVAVEQAAAGLDAFLALLAVEAWRSVLVRKKS